MSKRDEREGAKVEASWLQRCSLFIGGAGLCIGLGTMAGVLQAKTVLADSAAEKNANLQQKLDKANADLAAANAIIRSRSNFVALMDRLQTKADTIDKQVTPQLLDGTALALGTAMANPSAVRLQMLSVERQQVNDVMKAALDHCPN